MKIIKKYKDAKLLSCSKKHKEGCYLKLEEKKIKDSEERVVVLDRDKKNKIVGIDLKSE
jgi:hypothetical protein